jgi:Ni2+-binding GTPase involved in maturation of urease and hydrogenase
MQPRADHAAADASHAHRDADHHHDHAHTTRLIRLEHAVLARSDALAAANRRRLAERGVAVNVLAPPGAGKTTLLERTIAALRAVPFRATDLVVVNKIDLTPQLAFAHERWLAAVSAVHSGLDVLSRSATHGDELAAWYAWPRSRRAAIEAPTA